jgi:hypothetical protein
MTSDDNFRRPPPTSDSSDDQHLRHRSNPTSDPTLSKSFIVNSSDIDSYLYFQVGDISDY